MLRKKKPYPKANTTGRVQERTSFKPIKEKIDNNISNSYAIKESRPMLPHQVNSQCVQDNRSVIPIHEGEH